MKKTFIFIFSIVFLFGCSSNSDTSSAITKESNDKTTEPVKESLLKTTKEQIEYLKNENENRKNDFHKGFKDGMLEGWFEGYIYGYGDAEHGFEYGKSIVGDVTCDINNKDLDTTYRKGYKYGKCVGNGYEEGYKDYKNGKPFKLKLVEDSEIHFKKENFE